MCLFVPTRTAPDARKHWRLGKPGQKLATELCLFVPAPKVAVPRKLLKRFGVPIADLFEHLPATIADATPLYELCASVLE
jgi:hypothetical protein